MRLRGRAESQWGCRPPGHCSGFRLLSFLPPRAVRHTAVFSTLTAQGHQAGCSVCSPYRDPDSGARRADPGPGTRFPTSLRGTCGMADAQPKRVQALPIISISGSRGLMVLTDSAYLPQIHFFRVTLDHITALSPQLCAAASGVSPSSLASGL